MQINEANFLYLILLDFVETLIVLTWIIEVIFILDFSLFQPTTHIWNLIESTAAFLDFFPLVIRWVRGYVLEFGFLT